MQEANPKLVCYYVVFNKANATEAQARLEGTTVTAVTMHSLGFRSMAHLRLRCGSGGKDLYKTSKSLEAGLSHRSGRSPRGSDGGRGSGRGRRLRTWRHTIDMSCE